MSVTPTVQPANVGAIMQDMFNKLTPPDAAPASNGSATNGAPPVITAPPISAPVSVEPKAPVAPTQQLPAAERPTAPKFHSPGEQKAPEPVVESDVETNFFTDEEPEAEAEEQAAAPEADEEPDMSDVPDKPSHENWKKAREALRLERKERRKFEKLAETERKEREAWSKGEKIPEVLTAKDSEIQRLQQIERQVNGRLSEEYQELVIKPSQVAKTAFTKLAENYQVPENIREALVAKIVSTENERERNALITKYFPDALGANSAKELVLEMHKLGQIALDMEAKPTETHQTLQAKYAERLQEEDTQRTEVFENVSKGAWDAAIDLTAKEGIYSDLIMDPSNAEHNKVAERNQHRAAIQFGALVKQLKAAGLKTLPDNVAKGLARSILLSIGGVGAYKQAQKLSQELREIRESSSVQTTYFRPGANGNGFGSTPPQAPSKGPMNADEAGRIGAAFFNGKK